MSVSFPKPLTDKEEKYYISLWEKGDEQAREILIERNLRPVSYTHLDVYKRQVSRLAPGLAAESASAAAISTASIDLGS